MEIVMSIARFNKNPSVASRPDLNKRVQPQRGHVLPRLPIIDINSPGRLRSGHILALCGFAHSTLYARMKSGDFPRPDGKDGGLNFWNTDTIKSYLEAGVVGGVVK
jgi:predicted DNA-binding transcriptional regulator AlpA